MTHASLNPVTVIGAGAGSQNQAVICQVVVGFAEFYPGIKGEIFCKEIIPNPDEPNEDSTARVEKEVYGLVRADRDSIFHYNMNVSTEGYRVGQMPALKFDESLYFPSNCFHDIPYYEDDSDEQ